jgi:3-dehydroshikimate dehydratase
LIQAGLASVSFRSLGPSQIVELCAEAGLSAIEWGSDIHVPLGDLSYAKQVGDRTRDAGLTAAWYGSYFRADGDLSFQIVVDTAMALGAPNIRVWAGKMGSGESDESARQKVVKNLQNACEIASKSALTVSAECHGGTLTDTVDSALNLAREIALPNFKLYWQPDPAISHSQRLADLDRMIPFLSHIHVFQWSKEGDVIKRHPLVDGSHEWLDYLRVASGNRVAFLEFLPAERKEILFQESKTLLGLL